MLSDPQTIDEQAMDDAIHRQGRVPRIQFSGPSAATPEILAQVNHCCRRFGSKVIIRFFGYYKTGLDLRVLEQLPDLRSLIVDVRLAVNLESLRKLAHLEELAIGISEGGDPNLLDSENLFALRRLTLLPTRKSNIDLAPLASFASLEDLTLCGHARNLSVVTKLVTVKKLGLSGIRSVVRLDPVEEMTGLRTLWVVLGGRATTGDFANPHVEQLRIDRIRGLEEIDLSRFPRVMQLCIEDQSKIGVLDVGPLAQQLDRLQIF